METPLRERSTVPDENRLVRIEQKLDQLGEAMINLVRMEERMVTLFKRMDVYEAKQERLSIRLDRIDNITAGRGVVYRYANQGLMIILGAAAGAYFSKYFR